ncbi:3514_t:CDS:2, partial [Entrophospora sp. SA101]
MPNLLNLLPPELIPFITKYLPIQDLKNCCSLNDIWKTEVIREIRKRLIVDCTFVNRKTTVKALIDPKSKYGSISKALAQKMGLYITRMYGSKYPAVEDLGIGATNAGKKVMRRGWVDREKVSVTLPNIFELGKLKSLPRYLNETFTNFVVIDKPEYDLVLGSSWLTGRGIDIDFYGYKICRNELWEKKGKCYWREDSIEILPRSLHIFYEMLFPKLIGIDRDGDIILTRFSDKNMKNSLIDLRKIPVKALIDTSSKFNTISRCLFDKLEEYYGIRDPDENLYEDVIGEIKCLDLQFQYKGKWQSLDDGMSIPLNGEYSRPTGDSLSHKTSSTKNNLSKSMESKPGLAQEEAINIINKILSGTQNIKHQKSHRGIFHNIPPAPPTPRRLNDDVSKNKSKKNRVNYSTDSDTSSNSDISDSSDSSLTRLRSELINMHKTSSAKKRPIKRRRCKVKRKKLVRSTMSRYNGPQGA